MKLLKKLLIVLPVVVGLILVGIFMPARKVTIEGFGTLSFETTVTLSVGSKAAYASPDVEILRPDAAGDECNIVGEIGADCPNHYLNVDEVTPDEGTTCVYTGSVSYQRDLYNIADHSVGSGIINLITVYARCGANTFFPPSQASLRLVGKTGGTVYESGEITVTSSWADYSIPVAVNPQTGNPWTWDEIDNLQVGVSLRRPTPFSGVTGCTQVWVAVDYTPQPDISNTPSSKNFGNVLENSDYWSNDSAPTFPLDDSECYFTVTNNSSDAVDISIRATDFIGGDGWTLAGSPGAGAVTLKAGQSGDNAEGDMVTLTNSDQGFVSDLAVSESKMWEIKLETGTFTDGVPKTSTITLTATFT